MTSLSTREMLYVIFSTYAIMLASGTVLFHFLEPFTWIQAFYFSVSTMTTVGYGDLAPSNDFTRLAVSIYILITVTLYISLATYLGTTYLQQREKRYVHKHEAESK